MVYFDDVTNNNDPHSSYCIAHVRPYGELNTDLRQNTQARYNFITPNLCDDMHNACSPFNDSVKQGDTWLAQNIPGTRRRAELKDARIFVFGNGLFGFICAIG